MTVPAVLPASPQMPLWEILERARRNARTCGTCKAVFPNHLAGYGCEPVPGPDGEKHECGYREGTLGCRMAHRRQA